MTTYPGCCHCGRVRFTVEADIDHVRVCDCSVCVRRGALLHRVATDQLRLLTPWEDLSTYRWGTCTATDYFCRACGILPFRRPSRLTELERRAGTGPFSGWSVNVRCLDGIDLAALAARRIAGSEIELP